MSSARMFTFDGISHLVLEVTDLQKAEEFYVGVLGMEFIHRDQGELGGGRIIVKNVAGQLLLLEKVERLSRRSRFRGWDRSKVPDPEAEDRYAGAHLAMSVGSLEEYDEIYDRLERYGVYSEGDIRAAERAAGQKSVYFYDPSGNRLQLIILPSGPLK